MPHQRYEGICDLISDMDSDKIHAALGNELETFQNGPLDLFKAGMRDVPGRSKTGALASKFYLYLVDLWISAQKNIWEVRGESNWGSETFSNRGKIQESSNKFELIYAGRQEATHILVEENNRMGNGGYKTYRTMDTFYTQSILIEKMSTIRMPR